jgi:hypothetical protein
MLSLADAQGLAVACIKNLRPMSAKPETLLTASQEAARTTYGAELLLDVLTKTRATLSTTAVVEYQYVNDGSHLKTSCPTWANVRPDYPSTGLT